MSCRRSEKIARIREYAEDLMCTLPGYALFLMELADDLEEEMRTEESA